MSSSGKQGLGVFGKWFKAERHQDIIRSVEALVSPDRHVRLRYEYEY
jgi:hypothetical protein